MIYRGVLLFVNCFVAVTSAPFARVATRGGSSVGVNNNKSYAGYQPVSAVVLGSHCAADAGLEAMMDDVCYSWEERDDGTDVCVEKSGRTDAIGAPGITQKPSIKASLMLHSTTNNRGGNHHGVRETDRSRLECEVYVHAPDGSPSDCGVSDGSASNPHNGAHNVRTDGGNWMVTAELTPSCCSGEAPCHEKYDIVMRGAGCIEGPVKCSAKGYNLTFTGDVWPLNREYSKVSLLDRMVESSCWDSKKEYLLAEKCEDRGTIGGALQYDALRVTAFGHNIQSRTPSNSRQCNSELMMLQATTVNGGGSRQFNTPWERSKGESEGLLWQIENTDERWGERRSSGPIQHLRADSPYLPLPLIDCNTVGLVYQHVFAILFLWNARIVERSARDPVNRLLLMKTNKGRVSLAPIEYFVTQSTGLHSSNHQLGAYNHNQIKLSSRDGGTDESKSNNEGQHAQRSNVTKSNTGLTRPVICELKTTKSINGVTRPAVYGLETNH